MYIRFYDIETYGNVLADVKPRSRKKRPPERGKGYGILN